MFRKRERIEIKTPAQLAVMRQAGLVVARTLALVASEVRAGITTAELDEVAAESIRSEGALPSFLGYHGFPAHICVSVNDEVVHGIPGARVLSEGDLVSIDCGAIVDGWHGDAALSVPVGSVAPELLELSRVTEQSLVAGIAAAVAGGHIGDIGYAVEQYVRSQGPYGIVEDYVGHGIGTAMHMSPSVPNYGRRGEGPQIREGMALAIEPMVTLGAADTKVLSDDWTVVTADGRPAAHWEHSVAITADGPVVLTAL
ncbi:MAG: type I methionyl aminopeptidase [Actinobacteria bacterium]|jgi:methionyl aminopeptidase|nr:type I methionyl aminopeptidase [Actinomycetota bacterium]